MEGSFLTHALLSLLILFSTYVTPLGSSKPSTNHNYPRLSRQKTLAGSVARSISSSPLDPPLLVTSSTRNHSNTHYLKTQCKSTTYPKLCYKSLSSYATLIQTNPKTLANVALNVTLTATKSAMELIKNMSKFHDLNPKEAAAMGDCVELVEQAIDGLEMATGEMGEARGSSSDPVINDIQTWVSAALTDDDTCIDGLSGKLMDYQLKKIVIRSMTHVLRLTSIALAFVNFFASSGQ